MQFNPYYRVDYLDELADLPETYKRAVEVDVTPFSTWLREQGDKALLAVGAGGSLPVAESAARLHHLATGQLARAGGAMDLFGLPRRSAMAGLLVTASGGHSDSLQACRHLRTPAGEWAVFCGRETSRSADILAGSPTPVFAYDLLPELHGWVAVNALLGQMVVMSRAFAAAWPELGTVPEDFTEVLPGGVGTVQDGIDHVRGLLGPALAREQLIFLYGPDTRAAALDLDSKFAESGLGWLSTSEHRNFAHGRYQAVLPTPEKFGIASIVSGSERAIADATLNEIPDAIAHGAVHLPDGGPAAEQIASIVTLLLATGALSLVRDVRPGWGSADTFGDALYEFDLEKYFPAPQSTGN